MAKIPQEIIDEIVRRSDLVGVIGRYTQLRKQGSSWLGLCPFHSEKTPSFRVNPERGSYYCFGCQASGGLLGFVQKIENLPFQEVVARLGKEVGVEVEFEANDDPQELAKKRLYELLERCSHYYHEMLLRSPLGREGLAYLKRRGLSQSIIERFRLGWAAESGLALLQKLKSSGYKDVEGEEVGVLRSREGRFKDTLRSRVVFPIFDVQGRVVAFGGRVLDDSQPKYLNTPETPIYSKRRNLYGLNLHRQEVSKQDRAVVVEGYLDVVSLAEVGVPLAVASLGTALTPEQSTLLRRYTRNVVLAYDADRAGQNATVKGIELFEEAGLRVSVASLSEGDDPDSLARREGQVGVEAMLNGAVSVVDYLIARNEERFDLTRPEGKEDFAREVLPVISKIPDRVRQDAYVVRLARKLGISETQVQWRLSSKRQGVALRKARGQLDPRSPEVRLFRICLAYPDWFEEVRSRISPDQIVNERFRPIYEALWQVRKREQPLQLQDLSPYIEDPEALADLTELLMEPPPASVPEDAEKLVQSLRDKADEIRLGELRRWVQAEAETLNPEDQRYLEYLQLQRRLKGAR